MPVSLPSHARAVVIGGGVAGASVLYHLAEMGWTDVVLLERQQLTSGTTWHAAGLMGSVRTNEPHSFMVNYTRELYKKLEAETGQGTGFKQVGSLSVASDAERFEEYKRAVDSANAFGVESHLITPSELKDLYPLINTDDVLGAMHLPLDGQVDPSGATNTLVRAARNRGAKIFEGVTVTGVTTAGGRVSGVDTTDGHIACEVVVNAAGLWAHELGKLSGVNVPLHACEHFYVVTDKHPDIPKDLPVMREHSAEAYFKEDAGSLLIGAFEKKAKPYKVADIPADSAYLELPEDWDHFMPILEAAMHRVPLLENLGIRKFFNGPESFTPDDQFHMGEAPELPGYFMLAGFNSVGIQTAPGAAKVLADWIANGKPAFEVLANDPARNPTYSNNTVYLGERASETLGLLYDHHFPYRQFASARGVRRSPIHAELKAANACFGTIAGFERPNWFAPEGVTPVYEYSFGRQNWFDYSAAEHAAVRERVGLIDISSFGKIRVQGRDTCAQLNRICANDVDVSVGRIVYTQWCNAHGGIEADVTVQRLGETCFHVVCPAATTNRELRWLHLNIDPASHCTVTDVTGNEAVFAVMGPDSRTLLSALTPSPLDNDSFPFGTVQTIDIGYAQVRAARLTYVGELGWELHMPCEVAGHVFETLMASPHAPTLVGMHAMDSLRIEKGYRHFGHDIGEVDTPLEAGLGFAVAFDKPDFIGRDVLLAQREERPLKKRLVQFQLQDAQPLLYHAEPILLDGKIVGYTSSGNYGHHLGGAIAMGYVKLDEPVTAETVNTSNWSIRVAGRDIAATASFKPLYDPSNARIRA
ncbi:MAG: FAD-dependent oxidoreductase [Pseudomonadota bacterium]